jgi:4-alpha-glucanotransferase
MRSTNPMAAAGKSAGASSRRVAPDMPATTLDAWCEAYGIATTYRDAWGRECAPGEATKRALLRAVGVDPDVPADDARVLPRAPAPLVWREGVPPDGIAVRLDVPAAADAFEWRIALESGEERQGACRLRCDTDAAQRTPHDCTLECVALPPALPPGHHTLSVIDRARAVTIATFPLLACPARCASAAAEGSRMFGPAIQLYAVRSRRNWGIGDFTDLAALARIAAQQGADFVGLNPLHALFVDRPAQASPYSPSTRLALNPLYIDVEAVAEFGECADAHAHVDTAAFRARLAALRDAPLVDYDGVADVKLGVLALLFDHFERVHLAPMSVRARVFRDFAASFPGTVLPSALFDALQAMHARTDGNAWGWPAWPAEYRDRDSAAVRDAAHRLRRAIDFNLYLQWLADGQLASAAAVARAAGMRVGLYRDVAVGAGRGGAETWADPATFALTVDIGAPADAFNERGQDWGLPPWIPGRLAAATYAPWIALLRANMRHAGALRIDHVMAMMRLFWIPAGMSPADGTYVEYPFDDLLAVLALESARNRCAIVGEDLGTVPDALRGALRRHGVHSFRVLFFERDAGGEFLPPDAYPPQALVSVSTHDLPTLHGYWQGADLRAREALGLFVSAAAYAQHRVERDVDRARLAGALAHAHLQTPAGIGPTLAFEHVLAVHAYAARTRCALMSVQLEDVFGETDQVNLPGTTDDRYPNWRRKITLDLDDWDRDGRFAAVCAAIRAEGRGRASPVTCTPAGN